MRRKYRFWYFVLIALVLSIMTIGSTYAYWTATTNSSNNAINTGSTVYSISMDISSVYSGFSFIPMNDSDALKAIKNKCVDKYDRGACTAYRLHVYGYSDKLTHVSGYMNISTNNMVNLSYMMLREQTEYDEDNCAMIEGVPYCVVQEANPIGEGENLSLGKSYSVLGMKETNFILLIWLSNLKTSQNSFDLGSFSAAVTMEAGNGGKITGHISGVVDVYPDDDADGDSGEGTGDDNNTDNDETINDKVEGEDNTGTEVESGGESV